MKMRQRAVAFFSCQSYNSAAFALKIFILLLLLFFEIAFLAVKFYTVSISLT